jgi:hypothetical protein
MAKAKAKAKAKAAASKRAPLFTCEVITAMVTVTQHLTNAQYATILALYGQTGERNQAHMRSYYFTFPNEFGSEAWDLEWLLRDMSVPHDTELLRRYTPRPKQARRPAKRKPRGRSRG